MRRICNFSKKTRSRKVYKVYEPAAEFARQHAESNLVSDFLLDTTLITILGGYSHEEDLYPNGDPYAEELSKLALPTILFGPNNGHGTTWS